MNIFVDIEFSRPSNQINSIGAVTNNGRMFMDRINKINKSSKDILVKFYNYLPNEPVNFIFFGKEDMKVLKNNMKKYELPDNIKNMVEHMSSGIDIREFIKPVKLSLEDLVNNLGENLTKPLHDPLNDAINLKTLFISLHKKGVVSKLIKLYKIDNPKLNPDKLNIELNERLKTLDLKCKDGIYKKETNNPIIHKITLINKENGEQYLLNDISPESLKEGNIYTIKMPQILQKYSGNERECIIWILEHVDGNNLTIENFLEKMSFDTGNSLEFCDELVQKLLEKCDLLRLTSAIYQIRENIKFLDKANERRILFYGNSKVKIIC